MIFVFQKKTCLNYYFLICEWNIYMTSDEACPQNKYFFGNDFDDNNIYFQHQIILFKNENVLIENCIDLIKVLYFLF